MFSPHCRGTSSSSFNGEFPFYVWDGEKEPRNVVRWMSSFDTTPEEVDAFIRSLASAMAGSEST